MDDLRLVDHFALIGVGSHDPIERDELLPTASSPITDTAQSITSRSYDITPKHQQPIVDLAIIDRSHGEDPPKGYETIWTTPTGYSANLNCSTLRSHEMYLCIRRGRDKPPITDIGILIEGREKAMENVCLIESTPHGYPANICSSSFSKERTLITYRRAATNILCNTLAVTDICVIIESKGEKPPHSFNKINKNLNRSLIGPSVFLCYKKSVIYPKRLQYRSQIVYKYSPFDGISSKFLNETPRFCFPMGAFIERWPSKVTLQNVTPTFSTFHLDNQKQYGACISFYELFTAYERLPDSTSDLLHRLDIEQDHLYSLTCIVIFSRYPFFDAFRRFLFIIYQLILSSNYLTSSNESLVSQVPLIEQYLNHFFHNTPCPSPSSPRVFVQYDEPLILVLPEENGLPQNGASFIDLLKNLGTDNTLTLFIYALLESKILIHSLRSSVLTGVVEAVNYVRKMSD